jgi:phosphoesterase RecJ-like protein
MVKDDDTAKARSFDRVAKPIEDAAVILVSAHKNPDGDAIGSMLAMSRILELMGKAHKVFCPDGIPEKLRFLYGADRASEVIGDTVFDLTLLFDTSARNLLPAGFPQRRQLGTLAVIDHHAQSDDMGDLIVRFPASASGELLLEMARHLGWPIDAQVAESLYTAIVSDTSSFKYESTTPTCHRAAADLIALGADPWRVATKLFESFPLRRQRLLAKVLGTLDIGAGGQYGQMLCTRQMLDEVGASKEDLDGMVNFARAIDGVALAALVREEENGDIKLSLRSKGVVDASQVARVFGGGGHKNAGGAYLSNTTIEAAAKRVARQAVKILDEKTSLNPGAFSREESVNDEE